MYIVYISMIYNKNYLSLSLLDKTLDDEHVFLIT